jgi:hypothetical protein
VAPQLDDKNQSEKRPVSMRKVEANRRNALKSTGPKTPRGAASEVTLVRLFAILVPERSAVC